MKLSFRILLCSALLAVLGLSSCSAPKNVAYMQDLPSGTVTEAAAYPGILIEPNDLLNIVVTTKEPELGTLFNLQPGIVTAEAIGNSNTFNSNDSERGYRVDAQGNIIFPQLGSLHVEGLTREQLESLIKNRILKEGLLKDFSVKVSFANARVSIIGDVASPGNYPFKDDKYTLLQALADAGDLQITAKRDITLIREKNGKRMVYTIDLKSRELFDSPAYYLQQNDVIYVTPNEKKAAESDSNASQWRQVSTWMGLLSFVASMTSIIVALTN